MDITNAARRTLSDLAAHVACDTNARTRICDLDSTEGLIELFTNGLVTLYPEDDGMRRTPEVKAAAVNMSGVAQHIVYLDRAALEQPWL